LEPGRPKKASAPSAPRPPEQDPYDDPIIVAEVAERAGVGLDEFFRCFKGKEDCAQRSFESLDDDWRFRIYSAYSGQPDWRRALRAAAYEMADWMGEHPETMRFGMVEILKAENEMIRVRREESFRWGAGLIDRGREAASRPAGIPDAAALMAVGSIVQLLTHRLQTGVPVEPAEMVPLMMYMATRPYVGEELAREEFELPRPSEEDDGSK
jgi:AcrR family transcriptional regulator